MEKRNHNIRVEELRTTSQIAMGTKVFLLSAFTGWFLYSVIFYSKISNGFFITYNRLLELWGKYSGTICIFYKTDANVSISWFTLACLWIVGLLVYCLVKRSRKSWRYLWTKSAAVILVCTLTAGIFSLIRINGTGSLSSAGLNVFQIKMDDIRYGTNEKAGLYNGNLYKASANWGKSESNSTSIEGDVPAKGNTSDSETMLEVIMTQPESMYLKGFVGEYYKDGQWVSMDNEKKYEGWELFYWLHKSGFYGQTQLGRVHTESTFGQDKTTGKNDAVASGTNIIENRINIKNVSADKRYIYTPYELAASELLDANAIGDVGILAKGISNKENYQFTALSGIRISYPKYINEENLNSDNLEMHYRQWVYENYLKVPAEFSRQFESVLEQNEVTTGHVRVSQAKQLILQYLTDYFTYDENPDIEKGEEPLMYFLQKSGRGYDVHYASAATLMFRYLGIPSRYVEGFLVTEQMAKEAGKSSIVSLDDGSGHAWTEIYIDGVGWIPFEATPDYRDMVKEAEEITIQTASDTEGQELDRNLQLPESEEALSEQEENLLAGAIKQDEKQEEDRNLLLKMVLFIGVMILVIAIGAVVYIILKIRKQKKLLIETFEAPQRSLACQNIFAYVMKLLEQRGFYWKKGAVGANLVQIKELFSESYAEEFAEIWHLHEVIRFGGKEPDEYTYERIYNFLYTTKSMLKEKMLEKS